MTSGLCISDELFQNRDPQISEVKLSFCVDKETHTKKENKYILYEQEIFIYDFVRAMTLRFDPNLDSEIGSPRLFTSFRWLP